MKKGSAEKLQARVIADFKLIGSGASLSTRQLNAILLRHEKWLMQLRREAQQVSPEMHIANIRRDFDRFRKIRAELIGGGTSN